MKAEKKISSLENDKYFLMIKDIIVHNFGEDVRIILFGSRAENHNQDNSDYDVCIITDKEDKHLRLSGTREELENSNIPFKVDLMDFDSVPGNIQSSITKNGIEWVDENKI
jgi:uncharacterized protein